jgi:hypothetical protein
MLAASSPAPKPGLEITPGLETKLGLPTLATSFEIFNVRNIEMFAFNTFDADRRVATARFIAFANSTVETGIPAFGNLVLARCRDGKLYAVSGIDYILALRLKNLTNYLISCQVYTKIMSTEQIWSIICQAQGHATTLSTRTLADDIYFLRVCKSHLLLESLQLTTSGICGFVARKTADIVVAKNPAHAAVVRKAVELEGFGSLSSTAGKDRLKLWQDIVRLLVVKGDALEVLYLLDENINRSSNAPVSWVPQSLTRHSDFADASALEQATMLVYCALDYQYSPQLLKVEGKKEVNKHCTISHCRLASNCRIMCCCTPNLR